MPLVLVAVFIPMLFMGGYVGLFVREFAVTLAVAILISLIVALTTTPMMCARLLKVEDPGRKRNRIFQLSEQFFSRVLQAYDRSLGWALNHAPLMMFILFATIFLNIYLYFLPMLLSFVFLLPLQSLDMELLLFLLHAIHSFSKNQLFMLLKLPHFYLHVLRFLPFLKFLYSLIFLS